MRSRRPIFGLSVLIGGLVGVSAALQYPPAQSQFRCFIQRVFYPPYEPESVPPGTPVIAARGQTEPVLDKCDAADDPAIWANPKDPAASLIVATNKQRGLNVYRLDGSLLSRREVGATNNVDIRSGIMANGRANVIVGASNKGASRIEIFALDTKTGTLEDILTAPINARVEQETYGFCFYQSRRDNSLYAFVTDKSGAVEQWRIGPEGAGLTGTFVRKLRVPSQPEGCVADDANAVLYVGEEDIGIWKFSAEPDAGQEGTLIAQTGHAGADAVLTADVEGLALFVPPGASDTDGFLIASSQGSASYAVFDRAPPHRHRGTFQIAWQGQYTADTDGLDVSAANFGNQFPGGLLVVQDGINAAADRTETYQNFKLAAWADVARELGLNAP